MVNVLVLNQHSKIAHSVVRRLQKQTDFRVTELKDQDFKRSKTYVNALKRQNVIASFLGPMDVDLDFEALYDAISLVMPPLRQFVMLSHAGIDDEIIGKAKFPGIKNVSEYLNEQRYAAKVVDESEIPYTILRPVTVTSRPMTHDPMIVEEGHSVDNGTVSYQDVAQVATDVIAQHRYVNQSIAIIDKK